MTALIAVMAGVALMGSMVHLPAIDAAAFVTAESVTVFMLPFIPNRSLDFTSFCFYLRCIATISLKA